MIRGSEPEERTAVPRWVTVTLLLVAATVLLAALVVALTGGDHGPGRHLGLLAAAYPPAAQ